VWEEPGFRGYASRVKCIGHGGASALAPANTLRSFELAADLGADLIEFDVRRSRGRLVCAHSPLHVLPGVLQLEDALDALAGPRFAALEFVADLKTPGTEAPVVDALRRHGLLDRSIIASQCVPILARVREHDPHARTGISIAGRLSRRKQRWRVWREEVAAAVRECRYDAVMAHRNLIDAELADRIRSAGGQLHAWTARGRADVDALRDLGLDGVVCDDPRHLYGSLEVYQPVHCV
jgi:glycerophosphoryl diester phosphodiesterase